MTAAAEAKLARLVALLDQAESVLICYSGGVDSATLLAAAHRAPSCRSVGMTAVSPSLPASEHADAVRIATQIGAEHRLERRCIDAIAIEARRG